MIKHITKQKEKKRRENQKNEVIKRKCKDKKKKENIKENFEVLYKVSGQFLSYNMPLFLTKSLPFQFRQNSENPIFKS